jgi:hypothetical protein
MSPYLDTRVSILMTLQQRDEHPQNSPTCLNFASKKKQALVAQRLSIDD